MADPDAPVAITRHDFRAVVRKRRTQRGEAASSDEVLPPARTKAGIAAEAQQAWDSIQSMTAFLQQQLAPVRLRAMSAAECEEVESVAAEFAVVCTQQLDALKAAVDQAARPSAGTQPGRQHTQHLQAVVSSLYEQLSEVASLAERFRARAAEEALSSRGHELRTTHPAVSAERAPPPWEEVAGCVLADTEELPAAERQQLELENSALQDEFSSLVDDVRRAESRMVEISQLSHVLSTKLVEQSEQLDTIYTDSIHAAEAVRAGNRSLESAERHTRSSRLFQVGFFVVASLLLLLLDWWHS